MVTTNDKKPLFALGQVVSTPGALDAFRDAGQTPMEFIQRHVVLEQGELGEEDHQLNKEAVTNGERILSSYLLKDGTKIWIITEADRSVSTLLLPNEY